MTWPAISNVEQDRRDELNCQVEKNNTNVHYFWQALQAAPKDRQYQIEGGDQRPRSSSGGGG